MTNIFEGHRVRLRPVEPADWEHHYRWNFDTDSARHSSDISFPESRETVKAWTTHESLKTAQGDNFRFQIETLEGDYVGVLTIHSCDARHGRFMYGLAILPEQRRRGYASEAIRLALRYYFDERRYQKVNVTVYSFNVPSIQLHESMGFVQEGRLRRTIFTNGEYHDELLFGMTLEEFKTLHAAKLP